MTAQIHPQDIPIALRSTATHWRRYLCFAPRCLWRLMMRRGRLRRREIGVDLDLLCDGEC